MRVFAIALITLGLTAPCLAGFYKEIAVDGDFSDWADVPVVDDDPVDNVGGVDLWVTKVANDANFLYIYNSFHTANAMPLSLSIDIDNNLATGFNTFSANLVGADVNWQNDFPFTSGNGVYNDGLGMSGGLYGTGAAAVAPFADEITERELAISLDLLLNRDGSPVFGSEPFTMLLWSDDGFEVSAAITYQLAAIPEPSSLVLGALVSIGAAFGGRRQR